MSLIVCICDFWQKRKICQIENGGSKFEQISSFKLTNKTTNSDNKDSTNSLKLPVVYKRLCLTIDGINAFYLIKELKQFRALRRYLLTNPAFHGLELFWIKIVPPKKDIIDYKWNRMLTYSIWERIEIEYFMSWLSTLGGGYSALGEQYARCAETAGKISLKQLSIGLRLGDPFLQARCKLYYSISLIQTGHLKAAKHLIRQQYEFAKQHRESDIRLMKMCKGIWLRLQYEYGLRIQEKRRKQLVGAGDGLHRQIR